MPRTISDFTDFGTKGADGKFSGLHLHSEQLQRNTIYYGGMGSGKSVASLDHPHMQVFNAPLVKRGNRLVAKPVASGLLKNLLAASVALTKH